MVVHKSTRLTPYKRRQLAYDYYVLHLRKNALGLKYGISYPTVQKILLRARHGDYTIHRSVNKRYQALEYGLKRLSKVQSTIEAKLKKQAMRYEKDYPGEMVHLDTKCLPLLKHETRLEDKEYLFVAIDDYSRELYAGIYDDKSSWSSAHFLRTVLQQCPYTIERLYTDNGTEYKGRYGEHAFMRTAGEAGITQRFTKVRTPQTNGKAERVIRTLMEGWYAQNYFKTHHERKRSLQRYVNYYNCVKPHKGIDNATPLERLCEYFYPPKRLKDTLLSI